MSKRENGKSRLIGKSNKKFTKKRTLKIITTALAGLLILVLGVVSGWIQYGYNYVRCGSEPIAVHHYFAVDLIDYSKPGDANYPGPNMFYSYVCTGQEAINLGAKYVPSGYLRGDGTVEP